MKQAACLPILLAGLVAGCVSGPIRARVLDAETRQPIPGAVVLGVWTKIVGPLLYHHELVGVRETETDAQGRFELERLPSSGLDGEGDGQAITVYKFGYVAWSNIYLFPTSKRRESQRIPREIFLDRFPPGSSHERHVYFIWDATRNDMYPRASAPKFQKEFSPEFELYRQERR